MMQQMLLGYGRGGGVTSQIDTSAAHFFDFSTSYDDQVGSINFNTNTSSMALGSSSGSYGQPPGWSGGYGFMSSATTGNSDFMRTTTLPDMSGDFCIDCCSYNPHAVNSSSNMVWSLGSSSNSQWVWYIYNYQGTCNADSANANFNNRLGEIGNASSNYEEDKWCVSRYRRSGNTAYVQWYKQNGQTWQLIGSQSSATYSGSGNADGASGMWGLNGWVHSPGAYTLSNMGIAWMAYYTDGGKTDLPWIPGSTSPSLPSGTVFYADGSGFTDSGPNSYTVSKVGTNLAANHSTSKTGSGSFDFNGSDSPQYFYAGTNVFLDDSLSSWQFQCWAQYTNGSGGAGNSSGDMGILVDQYDSSDPGRLLFGFQEDLLVMRIPGGTVKLTSGTLSNGTWYHVMLNWDGTTHRLFVDGTLVDSSTTVNAVCTTKRTEFGGGQNLSNYNLHGYMEQVVVQQGITVKTSNFTPNTSGPTA